MWNLMNVITWNCLSYSFSIFFSFLANRIQQPIPKRNNGFLSLIISISKPVGIGGVSFSPSDFGRNISKTFAFKRTWSTFTCPWFSGLPTVLIRRLQFCLVKNLCSSNAKSDERDYLKSGSGSNRHEEFNGLLYILFYVLHHMNSN